MTADYEIKDEYVERYPTLTQVAERLGVFLKDNLNGLDRIDSISTRAKDPDRYLAKAVKLNEDSTNKYTNPKFQIQDQIGARITVFYLSDVERIRKFVLKYLRFIEQTPKSPELDTEFGYFGLHFVVAIPDEALSDDTPQGIVPEFFELQIKTLFQHAWSEAHHDIGYKTIRPLTSDERRKMAFTAAQSWGADVIFEDLSQALLLNDNEPAAETGHGNSSDNS